jgi:hypothetical protein
MTVSKETAVEAFIRAFRSGEPTAAQRAVPYMAKDIVVSIGGRDYKGFDGVVDRLNGQWPMHALYRQAYWSDPEADGDDFNVDVAFPPFGNTLPPSTLHFSFNSDGQIEQISQTIKSAPQPVALSKFIPEVKSVLYNALSNDTPVTVAYVDKDGRPHQSTRGSAIVFDDHQLGIWVRAQDGGLGAAIEENPNISIHYWDNKQRVQLVFQGQGRIVADEETRTQLFEMMPEVEQHQDPERRGRALIVDVETAQGGIPIVGRFRYTRAT